MKLKNGQVVLESEGRVYFYEHFDHLVTATQFPYNWAQMASVVYNKNTQRFEKCRYSMDADELTKFIEMVR